MKRVATYLFVSILTLLVFYGGAGVNVISWCCSNCEAEGIAVLLDKNCCDIHGHNHNRDHGHDDVMAVADASVCNYMETMTCGIERVSFNWNSISLEWPDLQPGVVDLLAFGAGSASLVPSPILDKPTAVTPTGPPVLCPRVYLSLLTRLLI